MNKERFKQGFVVGSVASVATTLGAVELAYFSNPNKIYTEIVEHPEVVTITSEIAIIYVLGLSIGSGILNGYIIPVIDRSIDRVTGHINRRYNEYNLDDK